MSSPSSPSTYNLLVLGSAGTGKTTFITRHLTGEFTTAYRPTVGVDKKSLAFHTNDGILLFKTLDTAGQETPPHTVSDMKHSPDAVMVFFDVTSKTSFTQAVSYCNSVLAGDFTIPVVLVGNKADLKSRKVQTGVIHEQLTLWREFMINIQYYDISGKSNYNFEKPFLYLARKISDNANLVFVEAPGVMPPEVVYHPLPQQ